MATTPTPTAPPVVIVRIGPRRHLVGTLVRAQLTGDRHWAELTSARRLMAWPPSLGLDGLSVAAHEAPTDEPLQLGPALPRHWASGVEAVWWTTPAAGAALLALPVHVRESPARPLVAVTDLVATNCAGAVLDPRKPRGYSAVPTPAEVFRP